MSKKEEDTIAAIATPLGESGIGIVRISGPLSFPILKKIAVRPKGKDWQNVKNHSLVLAEIRELQTGTFLDQVLIGIMNAPFSFTGEDTVEINCHGGPFVLEKVLELTLKEGARLAEPGEFSRRAFLNGKLDLTQAEAVIDLIKAKSDIALKMAASQLEGTLGQKIKSLKKRVLNLYAYFVALIDFPEDEIKDLDVGNSEEELRSLIAEIDSFLNKAEEGMILRRGIYTAIIGRPNAGKSSLLNLLLGQERAIVTEIPGTTRDTLEENLNLKGLPLVLVDTAGFRKTQDKVEKIGVERLFQSLDKADVVLFMLDVTLPWGEEEEVLYDKVKDKNVIFLINKTDLPQNSWVLDKKELSQKVAAERIVEISALTGSGLSDLADALKKAVFGDQRIEPQEAVVSRLRHKQLLEGAKEDLENALAGLQAGVFADFLTIDLQRALTKLGEITGENVEEEVLDYIFAEFCLGK